MNSPTLHIGDSLQNGKYIIKEVIGIGGFGITYLAKHAELKINVCIKEYFLSGYCIRNTINKTVQLQGISNNAFEKYKKRFIEESQTLAKLSHPNIVKVKDVFSENETSYFSMDYIEGITLQQKVLEKGSLDYEIAVNYIAQLSEAIAYIHDRDILHRDIKPDNVLVTPENRIVLIDFGSAREFVHDKTQSHTAILTKGYAPLEQYSETTRKGNYSDIYSLGALFYFLLTGTKPMDATDRTMEEMPDSQSLNGVITDDANRTILKAMQLKPVNRHQTVQEFMDDLLMPSPKITVQADDKIEVKVSIKESVEKPKKSNKVWLKALVFILVIGLFSFVAYQAYTNNKLAEQQRIESSAFTMAKSVNTIEVYLKFIENYHGSNKVTEAQTAIATIKEENARKARDKVATDKKVMDKLLADRKPRENPTASNAINKNITVADHEMVYVQGGTFSMGSINGDNDETPVHNVTLSSYYIGKYEVMFNQYEAYCNDMNMSIPSDEGWGRGTRPVINVSYNDAIGFCEWLNRKTGKEFRLPTEAEWEYAARGGNKAKSTEYSGGNGLQNYAWYSDNSNDKTHPVGQKWENELGLYDMSGNVYEWCNDWYGIYSSSAQTNPNGSSMSFSRVNRGGGWFYNAGRCRVANRSNDGPDDSLSDLGFRLALSSK